MLAGGRRIEVMRTHGIAQSTAYSNLRNVVRAINKHPRLAIHFDISPHGLSKTAEDFKQKGDHGLFHHCVGMFKMYFKKTYSLEM